MSGQIKIRLSSCSSGLGHIMKIILRFICFTFIVISSCHPLSMVSDSFDPYNINSHVEREKNNNATNQRNKSMNSHHDKYNVQKGVNDTSYFHYLMIRKDYNRLCSCSCTTSCVTYKNFL